MSIILLLLEMFLKPEASPKPFFNGRLLGYILLFIASVIGMYFLFQGLIPVIGYLESGAIICAIVASAGFLFLFLSREKKKPKPIDKIVDTAKMHYNNAEGDLERFFKENAPNIILYAGLAGLTLYQIISLFKEKPKKD